MENSLQEPGARKRDGQSPGGIDGSLTDQQHGDIADAVLQLFFVSLDES